MDTVTFLCCWKDPNHKNNKHTLRNIVNRRFTNDNLYTVLKPNNQQNRLVEAAFQNSRFFRTNCNFTGYDSSELTFNEGDIIEVDEAYTRRYVYRGKHERNGMIGNVSMGHIEFVPIVELQPWYFHNISRQAARLLLLNSPDVGTFLVRKSNTHGQAYTLSIRGLDDRRCPTVKHYQINVNINGYYISEGCHAKYLDDLIQLYRDDELGYLRLNPRLTRPCVRSECFKIPIDELRSQL